MPIVVDTSGFTLWRVIYPDIALHAPECPTPLMESALRHAAREFFSTSSAWRDEAVTLATTVAGQIGYDFSPPANAELMRVHTAWNGSAEIDADVPGEEDADYPDQTNSTYRAGVSADSSQVLLRPAPEASGDVIQGTVIYTLSPNATGIPTWIYNEHRDGLAAGAAARLVVQPKKPWSNPQAYTMLRGMFTDAIREASNQAGPVRHRPLRVTKY